MKQFGLDKYKNNIKSNEFVIDLEKFIKYLIYQYVGSIDIDSLEDFKQYLMLKVYQRLKERPFNEKYKCTFSSYLYAIIRNGISNYLHGIKKHKDNININNFKGLINKKIKTRIEFDLEIEEDLQEIFQLKRSDFVKYFDHCFGTSEFDFEYFKGLPIIVKSFIKIFFWNFFKQAPHLFKVIME